MLSDDGAHRWARPIGAACGAPRSGDSTEPRRGDSLRGRAIRARGARAGPRNSCSIRRRPRVPRRIHVSGAHGTSARGRMARVSPRAWAPSPDAASRAGRSPVHPRAYQASGTRGVVHRGFRSPRRLGPNATRVLPSAAWRRPVATWVLGLRESPLASGGRLRILPLALGMLVLVGISQAAPGVSASAAVLRGGTKRPIALG
jgi:hypothetical protein